MRNKLIYHFTQRRHGSMKCDRTYTDDAIGTRCSCIFPSHLPRFLNTATAVSPAFLPQRSTAVDLCLQTKLRGLASDLCSVTTPVTFVKAASVCTPVCCCIGILNVVRGTYHSSAVALESLSDMGHSVHTTSRLGASSAAQDWCCIAVCVEPQYLHLVSACCITS
jgi:hypothetical protein